MNNTDTDYIRDRADLGLVEGNKYEGAKKTPGPEEEAMLLLGNCSNKRDQMQLRRPT